MTVSQKRLITFVKIAIKLTRLAKRMEDIDRMKLKEEEEEEKSKGQEKEGRTKGKKGMTKRNIRKNV